jgi:hypothetical protein
MLVHWAINVGVVRGERDVAMDGLLHVHLGMRVRMVLHLMCVGVDWDGHDTSERLPHQHLVVFRLLLHSGHLGVPPNLALMEHGSELAETTERTFESVLEFLLASCSVERDVGGGAAGLGVSAETFEERFAHGRWAKITTSGGEFGWVWRCGARRGRRACAVCFCGMELREGEE